MQKNNFIENINNYLIIKNYINVKNMDKISKKEIEKIKKRVNNNFFKNYMIDLILKWEEKNEKVYGRHLKKFKKLAKRFEINNSEIIKNKIFKIEANAFAELRSLKTLEPPYEVKKNVLQKYIFFKYQDVKLFEYKSKFINFIAHGDICISKNEIVICSKEKISKVIYRKEIKKITLKNYSIQIECKNSNYYIKFYDLKILYISLKRIWKRKNIIFIDESKKVLKTNVIKSILS